MNLNLPWTLRKEEKHSFLYGAYDQTGAPVACFESEAIGKTVVETVNGRFLPYNQPDITISTAK